MTQDILDDMIEVELLHDDSFNIIKETLTRIGMRHPSKKSLYQTAHIFHKKGRYYICHFKEMFLMDGKKADLKSDDIARRNTIASLLEEWGMLKIKCPDDFDDFCDIQSLKIVPYRERDKWKFVAKYNIGNE